MRRSLARAGFGLAVRIWTFSKPDKRKSQKAKEPAPFRLGGWASSLLCAFLGLRSTLTAGTACRHSDQGERGSPGAVLRQRSDAVSTPNRSHSRSCGPCRYDQEYSPYFTWRRDTKPSLLRQRRSFRYAVTLSDFAVPEHKRRSCLYRTALDCPVEPFS